MQPVRPKTETKAEEIVAFGVRYLKATNEYVAVQVLVIGDECEIDTIDQKRPYIQHSYAKAGDALIEHGIKEAMKPRR